MTPGQVAYPLLALVEAVILFRTRESRAQNAAALRIWLAVQLACFSILEPASFLSPEVYGRFYFGCTVISAGADLMVLYSIFYCLEDGFPAFGSARAWASTAILTGMLFCFAAELRLPPKAHGIQLLWLTADQAFTYLRAVCLIVLSMYGYLRASSWPRDLAWTWMAMTVYGLTDAVVTRVRIFESNTELFEIAMAIAAGLQLVGWHRALSYAPKPLSNIELEAFSALPSPHLKGQITQ